MRYAAPFVCAVLLAVAAPPSLARNDHAKGAPRGHAGKFATARPFDEPHPSRAAFSNADNTLVRVYFAQNRVVWTGLPPGIAKNYARGKRLPFGIAKKSLPADLQARLPKREGYEYARVGQDVILVETATGIVVDVIESVFG